MGITDFGFLFHKVECPQAPKLPSSFSRKRVEKRPATGRALGVSLLRVLDGGLCGGQTGDGDTEGRAGHVVETHLVAEGHAGGIAAVLAADAQVQLGIGAAAQLGGDALL